MRGDFLLRAVALVGAGLAGAVLALAGSELLEDQPETTTIREVRDAPSIGRATPAPGGLTINEIYERTRSGVVQINTTSVVERVVPDPFGFGFAFPEQQERRGLGSGFVLDKAGHVLTNYHVIADVYRGRGVVSVSFSERDGVRARIVGVDEAADVAVLKVDTASRALTALPLGDSDEVRVGDPVVAIGNPFGLERTVTAGIVSAIQRQISSPNGDPIDRVIQMDAQINQGNSGGPLLNARGEVVGVNTAIFTGDPLDRGSVGIGFAIPINTVKELAAQLIESGRVERAFFGVDVKEVTPRIAQVFRLPTQRGLLVQRVVEGSGAADAGLRAGATTVIVGGESYRIGGDIVVEVDGRPVQTSSDLRDAIESKKPGDVVEVALFRGDERETIDVELGRRTADSPG
jgi:S1-C subfamily serine protease